MKSINPFPHKARQQFVAEGIPAKQAAEMQATVRMYKSLAFIALVANGLAALLGAIYL